MTYEEALYYLKTTPIGEVGYTYEPIKVDVLGCAIDALEEALEKQAITEITSDKYRWHDLRKDPNDLPQEVALYEVVLQSAYSYWREYSHARYVKIENEWHWCDEHLGWLNWERYSDGKGGTSGCEVIVWREIEPFEESEC